MDAAASRGLEKPAGWVAERLKAPVLKTANGCPVPSYSIPYRLDLWALSATYFTGCDAPFSLVPPSWVANRVANQARRF